MSYFLSQLAPRAVAVALSVFAVSASAQAPHNHAAMAEATPAAAVTGVPSATNALRYESVFIRYKSYRGEKTSSWREANETVDRIGGWRAYAKESQQPDASAPAKSNPHADQGGKP